MSTKGISAAKLATAQMEELLQPAAYPAADGVVEVEEYDGTPAPAPRPSGGADGAQEPGAVDEDTADALADEVTDADISDYFRPDEPLQGGAGAPDDDEEQP